MSVPTDTMMLDAADRETPDSAPPWPTIVQRHPTRLQLEAIYRLRYSVYVAEMRKSYPGADHDRGVLSDPVDADAEHLFVEQSGDVVAALRMSCLPPWPSDLTSATERGAFPQAEPRSCLVGRLVVAAGHRRVRGVTVPLMGAAYASAWRSGMTQAFCHARPAVVPFFTRFGWRVCGPDFLHEESGCAQTPLAFGLTDQEYLRNINSPFVSPRHRRAV